MKSHEARESDLGSELQAYYRLKPQPDCDPVKWWADHRVEFPRLSRFALDLLAIPAMSADCERAFSLAKLAVTSQRHSLRASTIEKIQLLKNWITAGVIHLGNL
jgi:hypothetical protein